MNNNPATPFFYLVGKKNNKSELVAHTFKIEREGKTLIGSCSVLHLFVSADNWEMLKNKIDIMYSKVKFD